MQQIGFEVADVVVSKNHKAVSLAVECMIKCVFLATGTVGGEAPEVSIIADGECIT